MDAYIVDWVRTPRGEGRPFQTGGTLQHLHPHELLGPMFDAVVERVGITPSDIGDVIAGNANPVGDHADNLARLTVLAQGWPVEVPGTTVNRYCGSGQEAFNMASSVIASGMQDAIIASGVEMWSRYSEMAAAIDGRNPKLRELHPTVPQGISADLIATLEGITREELDAFGASSHQKAARAQEEGRFDRSLMPVRDVDGGIVLDHDEHVRPTTTAEGLAKLRPSFEAMGSEKGPDGRTYDESCLAVYDHLDALQHHHHAGTSSGMTDGAAACLLVSEHFLQEHDLKPRARVRATAIAASEPVVMLTGPTPASKQVLKRAGMEVGDLDLVEINEAFAAVPIKTIRDVGIDPDIVNVNGGAIALGHPVGATGIVLLGTLLDELERRDENVGMVTICTGAGMGTATVIERV